LLSSVFVELVGWHVIEQPFSGTWVTWMPFEVDGILWMWFDGRSPASCFP